MKTIAEGLRALAGLRYDCSFLLLVPRDRSRRSHSGDRPTVASGIHSISVLWDRRYRDPVCSLCHQQSDGLSLLPLGMPYRAARHDWRHGHPEGPGRSPAVQGDAEYLEA